MPFIYDAIQLFDLGYGPRLISVTPPGCDLAPGTKIIAKDRGKAPGYLTNEGWTGASVNEPRHRCHDYVTAKNWRDNWGANTGLVAGQGLAIWDNDQGEEFSRVLRALLPRAPRRFVIDPKHQRDAFLVRVVDGDSMEPEALSNLDIKFRKGLVPSAIQILARGRQAVIGGIHPGTMSPYAWDRELPPLDEIPAMTLLQFESIVDCFIEDVSELGWDRVTRKPVSAPVSAVPVAIAINADHKNSYAEAEALLAQIPNRDIEPSKANVIDKWLDDTQNWLSVGYAFAAFKPSLRHTPEARAVFLNWSDGRFQKDWPSDKVWASMVSADLRFGETALLDIVRQFVKAAPDFPDLDPDEFPPDPPKAPPKATPIWSAMKARWAFSKRKGFIDMQTGSVCDKASFADGEARRAKTLCRELGIKGNKQVNAANAFLRQPDMIEVFDITYAPGDGPFVASKDPGMPSFNRWKATTILAEPVAKSHIQKWLDHLSFVLGSDAERDRFLRWCAYVAQHPELKPNWHFLVLSDAGVGKDTMTLPLKLAVGKGNHIDITSNALGEQFNPWAECKLVIIGEFTKSRRGDAGEVSNRLKPLLAAPPDELTINQKNMRQYEIPNRAAVVMFSNAQNPLYLERGSRRVHVVNRLNHPRRDDDYYLDMFKWLDGGGAALCAAYILTLPLSDAEMAEFKGVAPSTLDKIELEEQNVDPPLAALEDLIADARAGDKADTPHTLIASADELAGFIKLRPSFQHRAPSARAISAWLRAMPGVHKFRNDPKHPTWCGMISAIVNNVSYSGRLWALGEMIDGRPWNSLSDAEIISIWKNLGAPKSATVIPFTPKGGTGFPDEPV
jgi:transcriptional regulator with XRE-family HTH domain